jgi:hypothetical protein
MHGGTLLFKYLEVNIIGRSSLSVSLFRNGKTRNSLSLSFLDLVGLIKCINAIHKRFSKVIKVIGNVVSNFE